MSLFKGDTVGGTGGKEGDGEDKGRQSCSVLRSHWTGDLHSKLGERLHNTWKTIQSTKTGWPLCWSLFHPLSQPITQLMDQIYLRVHSQKSRQRARDPTQILLVKENEASEHSYEFVKDQCYFEDVSEPE